MAQEVYKNNDGAVLFGNSGNVFRRPYDFNNCFIGSLTNEYIRVQGLTVDLATASLLSLKYKNSSSLMSYITALTEQFRYQITQRANDSLYTTPDGGFIDGNGDVSQEGQYALCYVGNNNGYYTSYGFKFFESSTDVPAFSKITSKNADNTLNYTQGNISELLIGLGGTVTTPVGLTTTLYSGVDQKHKNVMLFSRELSLEELKFIWNNGLLSEPITLLGCILYFKLEKAEILNNGGADFVGVRNEITGQPHGEIMNLPAGTLQEQLDYANANLFVPFID